MTTDRNKTTGRLGDRWVRVDGREIYYRRSLGPARKRGGRVVLVHGIASGRYFLPLAERLSAHYDVYVPDLPGVGGSERQTNELSLSFFAETLVAWMDSCRLAPAHLVGQSFGCNVTVEATLRRPAAVASIALQGLTLPPSRRSALKLPPYWVLNSLREMPRPRDMRKGLKETGIRERFRMLRSMLDHPIESRLPLIRKPALVIQGGRDAIVTRPWAREAARLMPRGQYVEVPRATHTMNAVAAEPFAELLRRFWADIQTRQMEVP